MTIDMTKVLVNYDGSPLLIDEEPVTLRNIFLNSLNHIPEKPPTTVEEKIKAYELSLKVVNQDTVEFKVDELTRIKQLMNDIYKPVIVGQVSRIIEGEE